ncbi:hypothetical protein RGQ29_012767 [Quercus rubra]|uniref:AP2/ERF domain-containing protein n=1 Tax=Quercus rubra TaxID=3512 RepID=A0AAN7JAL4_QUERU|nr:hypothetical protein RGQ29_012767 [Quercus rubra]
MYASKWPIEPKKEKKRPKPNQKTKGGSIVQGKMAKNPSNVRRNNPYRLANVRREETTVNTRTPATIATSSSTITTATSPISESEVFSGQPGSSSSSTTKHKKFRGARSRSGKWVSEIRQPRQATRIWLGTYPTQDMAATAYDVAALALRGPNTVLNFPDLILWYPIPLSKSPVDIRAAAACAAEARMERSSESSSDHQEKTHLNRTGEEHFIDEEELLNMPRLLVNMAEGMLLTPPRIQSKSSSDESGDDGNGDGDGDGLWSYAY